MAYHILHPNAGISGRMVTCNETGRYHRHKRHLEEFSVALCGAEVIVGKDEFCNLGIADPLAWSNDWCQKCVESAPWKPDYIKQLKSKGFFLDS